MSEPLSSHEIEDVLSSIRRLVSEDLRPALRQTGQPGTAGGGAAPASPAPTVLASAASAPVSGPSAGKLVLTQALRVVPAQEEAPAEAAAPAQAVPPAAEVPHKPVEELYDDAGLDEGEIGLQGFVEALADDQAASDPWRESPAADTGFPSWDQPAAGETEDLVWATAGEEEGDFDGDVVDLEPQPAMAAPSARRGHWTAETVPQVAWAETDEDWPAAGPDEPVPFAAHPRAGATRPDPAAEAPWQDVPPLRSTRPAARFGFAGESAADAPSQPAPEETVSTGAPAEDRDQHHGAAGQPGQGLFDADASAIDEEMLRDIVREIIREELAGTLGERITRNVRKLVRVEINRALTAREFE